MSITIRPATRGDYAAAAAIADEVQEMHANAVPAVFRHNDVPLPLDFFNYLIGGIGGAIYVAERGTTIVGYLVLESERAYEHDGDTRRHIARIEQIGVTHAARGEGIGRALMDTAINWAKSHRAEAITLHVWEFNQDAIAFYEHLGMHTESRTMALTLQ